MRFEGLLESMVYWHPEANRPAGIDQYCGWLCFKVRRPALPINIHCTSLYMLQARWMMARATGAVTETEVCQEARCHFKFVALLDFAGCWDGSEAKQDWSGSCSFKYHPVISFQSLICCNYFYHKFYNEIQNTYYYCWRRAK
jgi:hypothetical protein